MAEVEEPKQRGLKRVSGFDIGLETAIGELTGAGGGVSAAVALGERDDMHEEEADVEGESTDTVASPVADTSDSAEEEEVYLDEAEAAEDEEPGLDM